MPNRRIKFGTDGWRGVIGRDYTVGNLKLVSQAVAGYLGRRKKVAIGYDTRFKSDVFAQVAAEVLKNNGVSVILSDKAIPTPALSFTVRKRSQDLGIMITASHNPAEYNGFKIKVSSGGAADPKVTGRIERLIGKNPVKEKNTGGGRIIKTDLIADYVKFIRHYIDFQRIKNKKFKVLVDAMYGSGDSYIAEILEGTSIKLDFLHNTYNPSFAGKRPEPIAENLRELISRVKKEKFDLGLALDGDADRIGAVGPGGVFINPQKILGLLALHLNQDRRWSGGIVKTIAGSTMMDKIARALKIKLYETPVGFKYISDLMEKENILAGGEEAGGMGVKGYIPERDGTVAGLLLIEMMVYRNKNILQILNEMERQFGRYYYLRQDLEVHKPIVLKKESFPKRLLGSNVVEIKDYDGLKLICQDESWLMLRVSGTEPIVRVYTEAKNLNKSKRLLAWGKGLVLKHAL